MTKLSLTSLDSYVAFDLETTGIDPSRDQIIQVAAVRFRQGKAVKRWSSLVNPRRAIPRQIQELTGITDEMVANERGLEEVLPEFLHFVRDSILVAHNAPFDRGFLEAGLSRLGCSSPLGPILDTLEIARIILPDIGGHSLPKLLKDLGLEVEGRAHDARSDAEAAGLLFRRLTELVSALDDSTIEVMKSFLTGTDSSLLPLLDQFAMPRGRTRGGRREKAVELAGQPARPARVAPTKPEQGAPPPMLTSLDTGIIALKFEEGEPPLAKAVREALAGGRLLLAESWSRTGDASPYLSPAFVWTAATGQRVVISVHSPGLRDRLWREEAPLLKKRLGLDLPVALAKRRQDHICLARWSLLTNQKVAHSLPAAGRRLFSRIASWLNRTKTGDRTELTIHREEEPYWLAIAADGYCPEGLCPFAGQCYSLEAKEAMRTARMVITSHPVLLSDLVSAPQELPIYDCLIMDEAHHLLDDAIGNLGHTFDERRIRGALTPFLSPENRLYKEGMSALRLLDRISSEVRGWTKGRAGRWPLDQRLREKLAPLALEWENTVQRLSEDSWAPGLLRASGAISRIIGVGTDENLIRWVEADTPEGNDGCYTRLRAEPLRLDQLLKDRLFSRLRAGVLTSSAMTVSDSFEYLMRNLGLDSLEKEGRIDCLRIPPPFICGERVLLCVPENLPEHGVQGASPSGEERQKEVEEVAAFLSEAAALTGGRTMVLLPGTGLLRDLASLLGDHLEGKGLRVLAQGMDGGRQRLTQEFIANPRSVLVGTHDYWEGAELPEGLRCLIMVRIPFRPLNHPVCQARLNDLTSRGEDGFRRLTLPDAVIRFKQGFAHLMKSGMDKGVVVVIDPRLLSRRSAYGQVFIDSLPGPSLLTGKSQDVLAGIAAWFGPGNAGMERTMPPFMPLLRGVRKG